MLGQGTPHNRPPNATLAKLMHILLLEEDIDLGQTVTDHFEMLGHSVHWVKLCAQAQQALQQQASSIDLMIFALDISDGDPLTLLSQQRQAHDTRPALALISPERQTRDRIRSLQMGADDFLLKPLDMTLLSLWLDAFDRRHRATAPRFLNLWGVLLDFERHTAQHHARSIHLTALEWALLTCLAQRHGRPWSRHALEQHLYLNHHTEPASNSVEVIISRLRRKLGRRCIRTHRGQGYTLEKQ